MRELDDRLTRELADWLNDEKRDPSQGAALLYRLRGNPVEYRNLMRDPERHAAYILAGVRRFHDMRVRRLSHADVAARVAEAEQAAQSSGAVFDESGPGERTGKRADHDALPAEVQALYEENIRLMRRIREMHTNMRLILRSAAACKDADLLPFAEEIVKCDKLRLKNWKRYDAYGKA